MNDTGTLIDYKKGYGGSFGVEVDRFDKNASGFDDKDGGADAATGSRPRRPSLPKPTTTGEPASRVSTEHCETRLITVHRTVGARGMSAHLIATARRR